MENKTDVKSRSYSFSVEILKFSSTLPKEQLYWILKDQLVRSGTSIGANIHEAQAASTKKDFANYYTIAHKSANETHYWLQLLRDISSERMGKINELIQEVKEIKNILGASLVTLRSDQFVK